MSSPKKVLIVEDESLTAMALAAYLRREGYVVLGLSATGEEAVKRSREDRPDIVFMDVRLAGRMDGIEAAEIISRQQGVSIVLMTGHSLQAAAERLKAAALIGCLSKPIDFAVLPEILSHVA